MPCCHTDANTSHHATSSTPNGPDIDIRRFPETSPAVGQGVQSVITLRCSTLPQAMRDLTAVGDVPDLSLAASAAMLVAHESAKVQDQEAMMMLQNRIDVSAIACVA